MKKLFVLIFIGLCLPLATLADWHFEELARKTCRDCVIVRGYDSGKNSARLWLKMLPLADLPDGKVCLSLTRNMGEGPAGSNPTNVCYAGITVFAKTVFETSDIEVLMLADGKPISLGQAPLGGTLPAGEKKASNFLSTTNWETISKLGAADKLELHFGGMKIKFDDEQRAAVRDFLAYAKGGN